MGHKHSSVSLTTFQQLDSLLKKTEGQGCHRVQNPGQIKHLFSKGEPGKLQCKCEKNRREAGDAVKAPFLLYGTNKYL